MADIIVENMMSTADLLSHIDSVASEYKGDSHVLFSAIGAVFVGRLYGWRVIRVVLSTSTYAKYQKVLALDFKSVMSPETSLSDRSLAYKVVKNLKAFWAIVRGQVPIEDYGVNSNLKRIFG